jgi:hypothetical protein
MPAQTRERSIRNRESIPDVSQSGEKFPHLLGNIEKGKSKKKSEKSLVPLGSAPLTPGAPSWQAASTLFGLGGRTGAT